MKKNLKKKIILLSGAIVVLLAGLVATTLAWLTDTKTSSINFVMGDVNYECQFNINSDSIVVPGQPLFNADAITITNKSTVATNVRVKIAVTEKDKTDLITDIVEITFDENSDWVNDGDYWYYKGKPTSLTDDSANISAVTDPSVGDVLNFNVNMTFDGSKVGNDYSGKSYTITIVVEGKQAEYVLWENMANIDFTTGLAK